MVFKFQFFNLVNILNLTLKNYITFKICNVIIIIDHKIIAILSFWYCCALVGLYIQAEKMLKGGMSLDSFGHQILPSHWSKPWSYDQILDFDWW